ncbi:hypothetical protein Tco_0396962, partial [Tanacetum coccineum]
LINGTEDIGGSMVPEEVTKEVVTQQPEHELRKGKKNRTLKNFGPEFQLYLIERTRDEVSDRHSYCFNVEDDPKIFDEAMNIIRLLIAMEIIHNMIIHHMDMKTAFLNGEVVDMANEFLSSKFSMKDMGVADVILVSTSMDTSEKLMPNNVGKLSRYTSNLGTKHWQSIQVISNTEDNSSTSGWVFMLGEGASKKQTCITGSRMESKFVALAAADKEAKWLRNLILEIPLWSKLIALISIRCDSAATLAKAYSKMYNGKSRHLGVRHSMIVSLSRMGWYL